MGIHAGLAADYQLTPMKKVGKILKPITSQSRCIRKLFDRRVVQENISGPFDVFRFDTNRLAALSTWRMLLTQNYYDSRPIVTLRPVAISLSEHLREIVKQPGVARINSNVTRQLGLALCPPWLGAECIAQGYMEQAIFQNQRYYLGMEPINAFGNGRIHYIEHFENNDETVTHILGSVRHDHVFDPEDRFLYTASTF